MENPNESTQQAQFETEVQPETQPEVGQQTQPEFVEGEPYWLNSVSNSKVEWDPVMVREHKMFPDGYIAWLGQL